MSLNVGGEAFNQIERYSKYSFTGLYIYTQVIVIGNGVDTKYFANSSNKNYSSFCKGSDSYRYWKYINKLCFYEVIFNEEKLALHIIKIFKILIDQNMKKKDFKELTPIENSTMTKLANDKNIKVEVMAKICIDLDSKMDDIVEIIQDNNEE